MDEEALNQIRTEMQSSHKVLQDSISELTREVDANSEVISHLFMMVGQMLVIIDSLMEVLEKDNEDINEAFVTAIQNNRKTLLDTLQKTSNG